MQDRTIMTLAEWRVAEEDLERASRNHGLQDRGR